MLKVAEVRAYAVKGLHPISFVSNSVYPTICQPREQLTFNYAGHLRYLLRQSTSPFTEIAWKNVCLLDSTVMDLKYYLIPTAKSFF